MSAQRLEIIERYVGRLILWHSPGKELDSYREELRLATVEELRSDWMAAVRASRDAGEAADKAEGVALGASEEADAAAWVVGVTEEALLAAQKKGQP